MPQQQNICQRQIKIKAIIRLSDKLSITWQLIQSVTQDKNQ